KREDACAHGRDASDASRVALYPRRHRRIYFGVETRAPPAGDDQRVERLNVLKGLMRLERDSRLGRERLVGQSYDQSLVTTLARPAARLVCVGGHKSLQRPDEV